MSMIDRTVVRLSNVTCELLNMPPDSTIVMVDFKLKSYVCFIASTIHDKLLDEWGGSGYVTVLNKCTIELALKKEK